MSATKTVVFVCVTFNNHGLLREFEGHDIREKFYEHGCANTAIAWKRKSGVLATSF
jgi:hypothetical protein